MSVDEVAFIVLAKAPAPGRVKTRLCPPCTAMDAAALAEASLLDTLAAVTATGAARRVLALDGAPGPWLPPGFAVVPQRGDGLDDRLANAFVDVGGPALLLGMDTPQVTAGMLRGAAAALVARGPHSGPDAVLGPAPDGGYWAIGLRRSDPRVFFGVPMSSRVTALAQLERLNHLGLEVHLLPRVRDVDVWADAIAVASDAPSTRFGRRLATIERRKAAV